MRRTKAPKQFVNEMKQELIQLRDQIKQYELLMEINSGLFIPKEDDPPAHLDAMIENFKRKKEKYVKFLPNKTATPSPQSAG